MTFKPTTLWDGPADVTIVLFVHLSLDGIQVLSFWAQPLTFLI